MAEEVIPAQGKNVPVPPIDPGSQWRSLLERAHSASTYSEILSLCRLRARLLSSHPNPYTRRRIKLALLGGATTELLDAPLGLALDSFGLDSQILRTDYNTLVHEMVDPESATARFGPHVAVIVNSPANVPVWPKWGDDVESVQRLAVEGAMYWLNLCTRLHEHTDAEIVLNNFHPFTVRPLGNLGAKVPWDANNFLRRLNRELGDRAPSFVHINDVESLSAVRGLENWFEPRYWFHAKQPVSFDCLWPYVRNTARIVNAIYGGSAKCVVVDLDNTLWGGVVGDDGHEGVLIGEGDPLGEAFKAFQEYLLRLKQRGVLLAVCSKNDENNAVAVFERRPEMLLKRDDFVVFRANWRPKDENILEIASVLNIGLDALVFVDDNPAERELVRTSIPDVKVVELSDDPADYPLLLDQTGFFEITAISSEDQDRTRHYQDNAKRAELAHGSLDYASFLQSLAQKAVIRPFDELQLDRITQLINKTNQFNLTTCRKTRSEVQALIGNEQTITAYVRLKDRFGDNGLISLAFGQLEDRVLHIDGWLMSCRVLKRGVEHLLCNHLAKAAAERGAIAIEGVYKPTPKNGMVRDLYGTLGFKHLSTDENSWDYWRLDLDRFSPFDTSIEVVEEY